MKKVSYTDMNKYGLPPKHINVASGRFQGEAETGVKKFWMDMSHYLPAAAWNGRARTRWKRRSTSSSRAS